MSSSNWLGALALIAVLLFLGVIGLQVAEMMYYGSEPSVWPLQ